jgi:hypothetical protein
MGKKTVLNKAFKTAFGLGPGGTSQITKAQKNDGISSLMTAVRLSAGPDRFAQKVTGSVRSFFFKEGTEHIQKESFSEVAGTEKKRNLSSRIQELFDHYSFIHRKIVGADLDIVCDSERRGQDRRIPFFPVCTGLDPAVHRARRF